MIFATRSKLTYSGSTLDADFKSDLKIFVSRQDLEIFTKTDFKENRKILHYIGITTTFIHLNLRFLHFFL